MIRIQNIYYMLSYAFQVLQEKGYSSCGAEEFDNAADLLAEILIRGVTAQVKRGLGRSYQSVTETSSCLRGRLDLNASLRQKMQRSQKLTCTHDEFSLEYYPNRVLRTAMTALLRCELAPARRRAMTALLTYFRQVTPLDPECIDWRMRFSRNTRSYQMLMAVSRLVLEGLLQTPDGGPARMMNFLDEQRMCRLYEKFLLEYYRREHPELHASAAQIPWALDDGEDALLPTMQSDITLQKDDRVLIIDAKYYEHTMQERFGTPKVRSQHLYQLFTYVKNRQADRVHPAQVSGLLLYARTEEEPPLHESYQMSGNRIGVQTLDLDCDFSVIRQRLDEIAADFLHSCPAGPL